MWVKFAIPVEGVESWKRNLEYWRLDPTSETTKVADEQTLTNNRQILTVLSKLYKKGPPIDTHNKWVYLGAKESQQMNCKKKKKYLWWHTNPLDTKKFFKGNWLSTMEDWNLWGFFPGSNGSERNARGVSEGQLFKWPLRKDLGFSSITRLSWYRDENKKIVSRTRSWHEYQLLEEVQLERKMQETLVLKTMQCYCLLWY